MSYRDHFMASGEWRLLDDGTLDYVLLSPEGDVYRFDRDYVWDTFASHVATLPDNLAQLLAKEID